MGEDSPGSEFKKYKKLQSGVSFLNPRHSPLSPAPQVTSLISVGPSRVFAEHRSRRTCPESYFCPRYSLSQTVVLSCNDLSWGMFPISASKPPHAFHGCVVFGGIAVCEGFSPDSGHLGVSFCENKGLLRWTSLALCMCASGSRVNSHKWGCWAQGCADSSVAFLLCALHRG